MIEVYLRLVVQRSPKDDGVRVGVEVGVGVRVRVRVSTIDLKS